MISVFEASESRSRVRSLVSADVRSLPSFTAFSVVRSRFFFISDSSCWASSAAFWLRERFSSRAVICSWEAEEPLVMRIIWARRFEISSSIDSMVADLDASSAARSDGEDMDIEGDEPWREVLAWSCVFWR